MVEYQLPKLVTGVRFPSLAPNPRCGFDPEAPLRNAANRNILGAEGLTYFLLIIILSAFLSGCATAPAHVPPAALMSSSGTFYTVKPGDTLWSISRMYNVDLDKLVRTNNIADSTSIEKGQVLVIPIKSYARQAPAYKYTGNNESFIWPVRGHTINTFGSKVDSVINKGIDIRAAEGSNVNASRSGRIVYCDSHLKGFGKTVIIDHGDRFQTVYSHNSEILVNVGDTVSQRDTIARAGRTGRAKEPSLHFEIRRDGEPQNPLFYLPR
jgi:murein DD-endopeptidase MepM/ murein hydrolase activator NlpD